MGHNPTEADIKKCVDGQKPEDRMSYDAFQAIVQTIAKQKSSDTVDDFIDGLRAFDKDGSGHITASDLRHILTTLGEKLSEDEVEALIEGQVDANGNVLYEELVRMVMSG